MGSKEQTSPVAKERSIVQIIFTQDVYDEDYVEPFTLTIHPELTVYKLKRMVLEESQKAFLGPINIMAKDLKLLYNGHVLEDNFKVGSYPGDPRIRWPQPYVGSIFVVNRVNAPLGAIPRNHKYR